MLSKCLGFICIYFKDCGIGFGNLNHNGFPNVIA